MKPRPRQPTPTWSAPRLLPALLVLTLSLDLLAAAPEHSFVQDRFAIGLWVAPRDATHLPARYRELAEANFNLVVGSSGTNGATQLRLCQENDLRVILEPEGPANALPDGPACWGYLLADEPNVSAFPDLARRAADIRRERPGRFGYVNLFPNYASAAQLGTDSYEDHVRRFIEVVRPEVLSMDHYPLMRPDADTRQAYLDNLELFRRLSLQAGIPFWNYFYAMPFGDRLDPTEAQIRWQIFASIAHGAKGVLYFCYWTPGKGNAGTGEFPKGGAILTAEGRRTRHYDEARRINAELKHLGPTLMQLTSTAVRQIHTGKDPDTALRGTPLRSVARVGADPHSEWIVGAFRHADQRRALLILNHSYAFTGWITVDFGPNPGEIREVNKATGREDRVVDDSPELPGLQLSFGAGDGRLFLLPAGPAEPAGP